METLVIENLPEELRLGLKEQAARHHRSVEDEAAIILKEGVVKARVREWPAPYKAKAPLSDEFIEWAKREGRA